MKKLVPFVLCSTAVAICLGAVSAFAGFITPKVPPPASGLAGKPLDGLLYTAKGLGTVRTVTTVNDGGPGSLREAIASSATGDSINFALSLPATIVLSNTLIIATNVAVLGPGPDKLTVMRSAATNTPDFRVFEIDAAAVVLAGMTIQNGVAFDASRFFDTVGGGIFNRGALTVSNCVIRGNTAPTISLSGTNSRGFGGGIFSDAGSLLTILDSTVSGNQAGGAGGGICTFDTVNFFAKGCTVSGNFAGVQAGGINFQGQVGTLQNCTVASNTTPEDAFGSAILNVAFEFEGPPNLTVTACTVAGNTGSTNGAFVLAGLNNDLGLTNRLLSTLVAANVGPNFAYFGTYSSETLGHNLDSDGSSGFINGANGDLVGTAATPIDAKLGPLQNNGGPTATMALLAGSPAIDAGACADANGNPLLVDQRGLPRPQGASCDIGAYEFQPLTLICPPGVVAEFLNQTGAVVTFSATVVDSCPGATIVYTPPSGSVFPIGVTPVLVQATDSCSNSAQCSFNVTVLGAQGVKSNVLAELIALRASTNFDQPLAQKLDDAIQHLAASLNPAYWIDQTHLQPAGGNTAMNEEKLAVNKLLDVMNTKGCPVAPGVLLGFIDRIVKSDRLLATVSIHDAAAAGLNPKKIAEDLAMVARGDEQAAAGRYVNAIEQYRNAWRHALQLRLQVNLYPNGTARVQFVGNNSKSYLIEVSANTVDWAPLGTCKADAEGNVEFTDAQATTPPLRFYRAVEQ